MFEHTKAYPIWKFFTKIKLALTIIIVLAIVTGANTFFSDVSEKNPLGLALYHSWWYLLLLGMLFLNILICSIDRFSNTLNLLKDNKEVPSFTKNIVESCPVKFELKKQKLKEILEKLEKKNYHITSENNRVFAEKGNIRYLGPYFIHFGILIFIIGYIIGKLFGFLGTTVLYNDNYVDSFDNLYTNTVEKLGYKLELKNFNIQYNSQIEIDIYTSNKTIQTFKMNLGEKKLIPETTYELEYYQFIPDAMIQDGLVYQISEVIGKQCFAIKIYDKEKFLITHFLFPNNLYVNSIDHLGIKIDLKKFKVIEKDVVGELIFSKENNVLHQDVLTINKSVNYNDVTFYLVQYGHDKFKNVRIGLQIVNDPGLVIVWISFVLILIGVFITFFIYHKKIFIWIDNDKILISGVCRRNSYIIENELEKIRRE